MKVLWAQAFVFLLFCSKVCGFEQISRVCVCVCVCEALLPYAVYDTTAIEQIR